MVQESRPQRRAVRTTRGAPLFLILFACVVVALFVTGFMVEERGRKAASAASSLPATARSSTGPLPGVGDAARDGKFEFAVSRVDCSRTTVGVEHLRRTAKGKYCVITLTVRDVGASQYFLGRAQKAYDAAGVAYGDDEIAGLYANHDTKTFLQKIDPGRQVTGELVFDVPKHARLTTLELHDSLLSRGVKVALR